jgi:hypothetical protein
MMLVMGSITRRKQAILNGLRLKMAIGRNFKIFLHKDSVRCNLSKWQAGSPEPALVP